MRPEHDPTEWVDEWPLPGLSAADRKRIKHHLLQAHAFYIRSGMEFDWPASVQRALSGIASVLFDAKLLTNQLLRNELLLFVWEAAVAGNWKTLVPSIGNEPRTEIFPGGYLGNPAAWKFFNEHYSFLFLAEISEWTGKLLEREAASMGAEAPQTAQVPQIKQGSGTTDRRAFVIPLLDEKGWSILDWAHEADVSHATAMDYLDEKTKPFRSTRLKLAKALGIKVEQLPK